MTTKKEFLEEHNKLSPSSLRASMEILTYFKKEKPNLFKDEGWPIDKLRRPFIFWLTSLSEAKKEEIGIISK